MISIVGSYKYKNENGQLVEVSYVSDDRGFIPTGTIIHPAIIKNAELVSHNVDEEEEEEMHSDAMHHEMHHHETMHHDKHWNQSNVYNLNAESSVNEIIK